MLTVLIHVPKCFKKTETNNMTPKYCYICKGQKSKGKKFKITVYDKRESFITLKTFTTDRQ